MAASYHSFWPAFMVGGYYFLRRRCGSLDAFQCKTSVNIDSQLRILSGWKIEDDFVRSL